MSAAPEMLPLSLSQGIAVQAKSSHLYEGTVSPDFCYASALTLPTAHGGYVGSIILQAIHTHFASTHSKLKQPDTFTIQFRFLEATNAGPISVLIDDVKLSKNTSTVHFTATQSNTTKIVGYAMQFNALSRLNTGFNYPAAPPLLSPAPLPVDFRRLASNSDANWIVHRTPYRADHATKSQTQCRYALPRCGMPSATVSDGWVAAVQPGERLTTVSLGWLADQWPQGVPDYRPQNAERKREDYGLLNTPRGIWQGNMWYPTLTMDIELKKPLPEEGVEWVFVRSMAKVIRDGRMDLEVWVFDPQLEVVAVSHHVCFVIRLGGGKKKDKL